MEASLEAFSGFLPSLEGSIFWLIQRVALLGKGVDKNPLEKEQKKGKNQTRNWEFFQSTTDLAHCSGLGLGIGVRVKG